MMQKVTIPDLVLRRQYSELEVQATEHITNDDWDGFLKHIKKTSSKGKARDAVVNLLELEPIGGTDSDVVTEFSSLEGSSLEQVRSNACQHAISILREQIENRHTYFLDIDAMALTPYAVLVKDVIEARKKELEGLAHLEENPSRIDVLGTYYGFTILMIDGSKPLTGDRTQGYGYRYRYRRTWLEENLSQTAVDAVKQLTGEFAESVDMDKSYKTLGNRGIFKKKCTPIAASILGDVIRLTFYKAPGNRGRAANNLGDTEDSRVLPFLHRRLPLERNRSVSTKIITALGKVGSEESFDILKQQISSSGRYLSKIASESIVAIGSIRTEKSKKILLELLRTGNTSVTASAITALSNHDPAELLRIIAPYTTNRSKPIAQASVLALLKFGAEGEEIVTSRAPELIQKLIDSKSSMNALAKIFALPGVSSMVDIHDYFSKRIEKFGSKINELEQRSDTGYRNYYTRRSVQRTKRNLVEFLRLTIRYIKPPYLNSLIANIKTVLRIPDIHAGVFHLLNSSALGKFLENIQKELTTGQSYLET